MSALSPVTLPRPSVLVETIEAAADRDALLRPTALALHHLPELPVGQDEATLIRNGNPVLLRGTLAPIELPEAWVSLGGVVLAIGVVRAGHFHPTRVLR
jgi:tRNA pseudouridine55 synthase